MHKEHYKWHLFVVIDSYLWFGQFRLEEQPEVIEISWKLSKKKCNFLNVSHLVVKTLTVTYKKIPHNISKSNKSNVTANEK